MRGSAARPLKERAMALKIYGIPRSRAFRTLWMAKELGLEYENIPIDTQGGSRAPDFLKVNPNGHIPAIDDDGFVLWESMAINLYLAKKHARGSLYPIRFEDEALTWQWSCWGMTEIERPLLTALFHRALLPEDRRDAKLADESEHQLGRPLMVLDAAVANTPYLLGEHFTVADLNVAGVLSWARPLLTALFHRALLPEDRRDAKLADESEHQLGRPLMVLDAAVANTPYLLGR